MKIRVKCATDIYIDHTFRGEAATTAYFAHYGIS